MANENIPPPSTPRLRNRPSKQNQDLAASPSSTTMSESAGTTSFHPTDDLAVRAHPSAGFLATRKTSIRSDPALLTCFDTADKQLYDLWAPSSVQTTMVLRLKRASHSPSPFSWDSLASPRHGTPPPTDAQVAELPSPPTSWLSARDMRVFGVEPLRSDLGVVRCSDCSKPVLRSAISDHATNCSDIRSGKKWVKSKSADGEVELKKGKKRGADGEEGDDPSEPSKKKAKMTKGRTKGPVDYDKQCGVINDKGLPCSRSLTCKAHSMGAKRAVQRRSKDYDALLLEWNRANNPNWVEPVKKETKAEKKEKREKEKAEKKRLAMEAAIASGIDPNKATTKKAPKKTQVLTATSRLDGDEAAENLDDLDSEAEVDSLVKAVQEAQLKGTVAIPLAVPNSESSWFVVRRERLRNCRDLLASALAPGAARSGITGGIGPSIAIS